MLTLQPIGSQIPLIQLIESDDRALLSSPEAEWYRILYYFPWTDHRGTAAEYYDALYQFNIRELEKRVERFLSAENVRVEAKEEAIQRLLFSRVTMQPTNVEEAAVIYDGKVEPKNPTVEPETIAPGIVPIRLGGRKPKCFLQCSKVF